MSLFYRSKTARARAEALAASAEKYLGFKSVNGMNTEFEERTGSAAHGRWDGAFVWCAAEDAGVALPSLNDPIAGLAAVLRTGKQVAIPERGDLVWLSWNGHVGVVTDTAKFRQTGEFTAVEAQVSSGMPRAAKDRNGVYARKRYAPQDVLMFVRPGDLAVIEPTDPNTEKLPLVHPSNFQPKHPKLAASTELLQKALYVSPRADLENANRGVFDAQTRAAVSQLQRSWGWTEARADGLPDEDTLVRLAKETGLFRVRGVA